LATATEELMVGTVGWDYDDWVGSYYPDDLPEDWRFGYYSNDYRSVLVPADHLRSENVELVSEWAEDCDEAFRFVVQVPGSFLFDGDAESLRSFLKALSPLLSHVSGFYLTLDKVVNHGLDYVQAVLDLLQEKSPVCIDLTEDSEASEQLLKLISDRKLGLCWHPDRAAAPRPGGALLVALSDEEDARAQRQIIEALEEWMKQSNGLAGLFLESSAAASQARIIAEMLGI
jgi:uncharacterized protein YecE (DUF72 family)